MGSIECGGLRRGELMEYPIGIRLFISQDPKPEVAEKGYQTYQAIRQTQQPVHGNGTVVGGADRRQRGNPRSHPRQGRHIAGVQTAFGMGQTMQLFHSCLLQYPYRPIPQGGAIGFDAAVAVLISVIDPGSLRFQPGGNPSPIAKVFSVPGAQSMYQ